MSVASIALEDCERLSEVLAMEPGFERLHGVAFDVYGFVRGVSHFKTSHYRCIYLRCYERYKVGIEGVYYGPSDT